MPLRDTSSRWVQEGRLLDQHFRAPSGSEAVPEPHFPATESSPMQQLQAPISSGIFAWGQHGDFDARRL